MGKTAGSIVAAVFGAALLFAGTALATEGAGGAGSEAEAGNVFRQVGLGASAAFGIALCVIGAAHAVARIGSAAMGAAAEKPELLNRSLVFVALAEGLAVLGFVIAMMLVQKI